LFVRTGRCDIVELEVMMGCDGGGDGEMENRRNVLKRTVAALRLVRHAEACGTSLRRGETLQVDNYSKYLSDFGARGAGIN